MTKRERIAVLAAILIIGIGTIIALTFLSQNLSDHEHLDANSCHRATLNRELISESLRDIAGDPALAQATRDKLAVVQDEIVKLIAHGDCNDYG